MVTSVDEPVVDASVDEESVDDATVESLVDESVDLVVASVVDVEKVVAHVLSARAKSELARGIPFPLRLSTPGASISRDAVTRALRTSTAVSCGHFPQKSAAMPPSMGAAALVPVKRVGKPPAPDTVKLSAAAKSGSDCCTTLALTSAAK